MSTLPNKAVTRKDAIFWALVSVNLVVAVDVLSLMLMLPIIDTFAQHLGASKSMTGTLFTVYSSSAIISSFITGKVSDYFGRRYIFLLSAFGTFCSAVGTIFVTDFNELLITTAISGLFTGTISTAYAYIADLIKEDKQRARCISYVTATLSFCMVFGPLVGGLISIWQIRGPFYISACLACLETVLVYGYLQNPEDLVGAETERGLLFDSTVEYSLLHQDESAQETQDSSVIVIADVSHSGAEMKGGALLLAAAEKGEIDREIEEDREEKGKERESSTLLHRESSFFPTAWLDYRAVLIGGVGVLLNTSTYLGLVSLVPLLLQRSSFHIVEDDNSSNNDDLSDSEVSRISFLMGSYLSVYGCTQVLCILSLFPYLHRILGPLFTGAVGCVIYGLVFCFVALVRDTSSLYGIFIAMGVGNSLSRPVFPSYLSSIAPASKRAEYMSINSTCANLALVFGGQLTLLYSYFPLVAILFAGGLSLVNAVLLFVFALTHPQPHSDNNTKEGEPNGVERESEATAQ